MVKKMIKSRHIKLIRGNKKHIVMAILCSVLLTATMFTAALVDHKIQQRTIVKQPVKKTIWWWILEIVVDCILGAQECGRDDEIYPPGSTTQPTSQPSD
jgi:hypothetical protein